MAGVAGVCGAPGGAGAGHPATQGGGWRPARRGDAARRRQRAPRAPARQPAPLAAAAPLCRPRAHPLGPEAPPRAGDWPAGPLVGGAACRRGAVYSKGRACALRQSLARGRRARGGPAVRVSVLPAAFLLPLPGSAEVIGRGGRACVPSGSGSDSCGFAETPNPRARARGGPRRAVSGRVPTNRCGARRRPACAAPPSARAAPASRSGSGSAAARLALGAPQRQRRVQPAQSGGRRAPRAHAAVTA